MVDSSSSRRQEKRREDFRGRLRVICNLSKVALTSGDDDTGKERIILLAADLFFRIEKKGKVKSSWNDEPNERFPLHLLDPPTDRPKVIFCGTDLSVGRKSLPLFLLFNIKESLKSSRDASGRLNSHL